MPAAEPVIKPLVELVGVEKTFPRGATALAGLDLAVARGEFLSLVGPSGCGKSTALRLIAGLAQPTAGQICWADDLRKSHAREVSVVFQEPTLLPWTRVWGNVYLPLRLRGESRVAAQDRVDEALALVGLSDFRDAYPRQLSGGMKMRVAIARALVTRPKVLLMDEPFAALDEITRSRLNDDLLRLWGEQRWTGIFVTHSVYESVFLSQRVVVMSARPGRVLDEAAIAAPHPRDESFRRTTEYAEACSRVSSSLRQAVESAAAREA
ncbi:Aliphatic sulfonates import ATP-binding protein SsuB [Botrimarina colliarenosi]|uniref:Aliphatic sulfonates import ATP-binding protein SsuB n=1 Tax=Botrimarina colliarenosi TaxID=2528001 RepID=A0A5C6A492_9BACT|nr:ABC transporter ATP-binding protein [Botrimarina colliarenosi]TWT94742.1 Aliphatic sulfonates import ATP-binding protein SsuB [Botrimarina colliarenosi]